MADGNVVGAIFLDLRISTGIEKQIKEAAKKANKIAEKEFESINETLSNAIDPGKAIEKSLNAVENQVSKHIDNTFSKAGEKVKSALEDSIDMSDKELEEIMNRISFESFETKRTPATPEEMEEFMRPMEWSGKAGPPSELLEQMEKVEEKAKRLPEVFKASNDPVQLLRDKIGNINLQIEEQTRKLERLTAQFSELSDEDMGSEQAIKLGSAITSTEGRLISLQQTLISTQAKLDKVTAQTTTKVESAGERIRAKINSVFESTRQTIDKSMKSAGNSINKFTAGVNRRMKGLSRSVQRALKSAFLMFFLYSAFRGFRELVGGALKANNEFSKSVNRLKVNLMAAFAPIINVIIPALTKLISVLANVAQVIATVIAGAFGKTYQESLKMAEGINKAAKKATGSLAGFDQLNVVGSGEDATPELDFGVVAEYESKVSSLSGKIASLFEPFKNIDFSNLIGAFRDLKTSAEPITSTLFSGLEWLYKTVLVPFSKWTIEDVVPSFLNLLASAGSTLSEAIEVLMPLATWLWDTFLQPIAEWTGGVIVDVLDTLALALGKIGDWINEHQTAVEVFAIIVGSFAAAWGLVNIAVGAWNVVGVIATAVTTAFGAAVGMLTSPITLVIAAIAAVIAIVVLLVKNWNWVKETASKIWDGIVSIFIKVKDVIVGAFKTAIEWVKTNWQSIVLFIINPFAGIFKYLYDNFEGFRNFVDGFVEDIKDFFKGLWEGIKNIFGNVAGWFKDIFSRAWTNVMNVFSKGGKIFNGIKDGLSDVFKTVVNGLITGINAIIAAPFKTINSMLNKIRNISFLGISPFKKLWEENPLPVPEIPKLARGGIIEQPTLAMIGERGKEAVVPLENNTGWIEKLARMILDLMGDRNDRPSGDIVVPIYLDGGVLAEFLIDAQDRVAVRSNGRR